MRRKLAIMALAAATVVPLACGDDDSGSNEAATATDDAATATTNDPSTGGTDDGTTDATDVSDQGASASLSLAVVDSAFEPATIEAESGAEVTVSLDNAGALDHTFTVDGQDVDEELAAGSTAEVVVDLPPSGTLAFYCRFHRVAGMEGSFTVTGSPAAGDAPESATTTTAPPGGYGY
jgi:plastocyanin